MTTDTPEDKFVAFPEKSTADYRAREIAAECLFEMMLVLAKHKVLPPEPEKQTPDDALIIASCRQWVSVLQLAIGMKLGLDPSKQELLNLKNNPLDFSVEE